MIQGLRLYAYTTPKMYDSIISMDSIKGSSVFSQESDFAIAVTQTPNKSRYVKNVFFRYAPDDDETVKEFSIDYTTWLNFIRDVPEKKLVNRKDRRRKDGNREKVVEYLDQNPCQIRTTSQVVYHLTSTLSIKERQAKTYLSEAVSQNKIANPSKGHYVSVKCENGKQDEKKK